ncbi:MAG: hypothetical protein ACI4Q6_02190, partial [Huintestinicola sp.]
MRLTTAFSAPEYNLLIGGSVIDASDIISMEMIKRTEDIPVQGFVTSELVIKLGGSHQFLPNAEILFSVRPNDGMTFSFAPHFISRIHRNGAVMTIHAFDRMRMTEKPFDDSDFDPSDEPYDAYRIFGAIAAQCGFAQVTSPPVGFTKFYSSDIRGKRIRQILEKAAAFGAGVWYCTNDDKLCFTQFMSPSVGIYADELRRSPIYIHGQKGPINGVSIMNTSTGKTYSAGTSGNSSSVLRLIGGLFTQAQANDLFSRLSGKMWRSFACRHLEVSSPPQGLTAFYTEDYPDGLIADNLKIHFGGRSFCINASAADICEDEWLYTDVMGYNVMRRIEEQKLYGSTVITDRGLGIVSDTETEDIRQRSTYYFSTAQNGVSCFDGAMLDKQMPTTITKTGDTSREINYGGKRYTLNWVKDGDVKKN